MSYQPSQDELAFVEFFLPGCWTMLMMKRSYTGNGKAIH